MQRDRVVDRSEDPRRPQRLRAGALAAAGIELVEGDLCTATGAAVCETLFRPFGIDPPLHRRRVAFFVKHRAFSIQRARRDLGYAPKVPLDLVLRRTADWYFHLTPKAA